MSLRVLLLALLLLASHALAPAQSANSQIEKMTSEGAARRAVWGVYAIDSKTGQVIANVNGDRLFVPASNRKLVSTAMATTAFKADDRLTTELRTDQLGPGGVASQIILVAAGDPSWTPGLLGGASGTMKLRALARAAKAAGLNQVQGDLIIDTSLFPDPDPIPPGWSWDELAMSYGSRASALSVNQNLIGVAMAPSAPGQPVRVSFSLGVDAFEVINRTTTLTAGSAPTLVLDRGLGGDSIVLSGGLPAGSNEISRAVPAGQAVRIVGQLLVNALEKEGITVTGRVRTENRAPKGDLLLGAVEGATISEMLSLCNEDSNNFLAESLYLLSASKLGGRSSYPSAHKIEEHFWKRIKVDTGEVASADGSGLSRKNYISPRALVMLLENRRDTDWFRSSLPLSGHTGTLRHRLSKNGMAKRVQAKTGTLDGVSGLSGYLTTNSGKQVSFSIIANNYTSSAPAIRSKIDEIVVVLANR